MEAPPRVALGKVVLVCGAPFLLAVLELFHPHPEDLLGLDVARWMFVHYAQIPLFPLAALSVAVLLHGRRDLVSLLSRIALFVFAISFVAFDTAAGLVVGILVQTAQASGDAPAWQGAIDAVWRHPIVGSAHDSSVPSLSSAGSIALAVGTLAAAISLRRAGRPWPPVVLLAVSGSGLEVFNTHAWPGGPLTFGGIALAAAWLQWHADPAVARRDDPAALQPRAGADRRTGWRPGNPHAARARAASNRPPLPPHRNRMPRPPPH